VRLATVVGRILVSNVALFLVKARKIAANIAKLPELLSQVTREAEEDWGK
jgi:hypothetical protein